MDILAHQSSALEQFDDYLQTFASEDLRWVWIQRQPYQLPSTEERDWDRNRRDFYALENGWRALETTVLIATDRTMGRAAKYQRGTCNELSPAQAAKGWVSELDELRYLLVLMDGRSKFTNNDNPDFPMGGITLGSKSHFELFYKKVKSCSAWLPKHSLRRFVDAVLDGLALQAHPSCSVFRLPSDVARAEQEFAKAIEYELEEALEAKAAELNARNIRELPG